LSTPSNESRTIVILLVEDNPGDASLTQEAMRDSNTTNLMHVVEDGVEAMQFLRRQGRYGDAPRPDLILLDLNLPKKDGREVLSEIKADPRLLHIPVIILSSSDAERDLMHAYQLHASCFVKKAVELEDFFKVLRAVSEFWLATVKLPPRAAG
jgi:CheY-like chemotaxis protein